MGLVQTAIIKIITLPFIFICLTVHEFSHGWVAYRQGDTTAKDAGRLSLNPMKHVDWLGVLAMLFLGFGWAKPVPVNPYKFKKSGARGIVWVSLAGPFSNIVFAFLLLLVWEIMAVTVPDAAQNFYFTNIMSGVILLNVGLAVFNLIPVPPLDGSRVLTYFLPYSAGKWLENNSNLLYMLLILAVFTGSLSKIIFPAANVILDGIGWLAHFIVGIFA
ncbi:MAG: site-2 protease family protein [Monoglobales bacterium]